MAITQQRFRGIAMKFGTMAHFDPLSLAMVKMSNFGKLKVVDSRHVKQELSKLLRLATVWPQ